MNKQVIFGTKPNREPEVPPSSDQWVANRTEEKSEPMKRLTFDISETLHRAIKSSCAMRGTKMTDEIRALLEKHYLNPGQGG